MLTTLHSDRRHVLIIVANTDSDPHSPQLALQSFNQVFQTFSGGVVQCNVNCTEHRDENLTLQEVELTGRCVETHKVEAAGGLAASSLSRRLPGGQTLQHAAFPGSVQTEDQDLTLPTLLFLLQAENKDHHSL